MFQEKDIEAYRKIQAPVELKNRISLSVKKEQKKQRTVFVTVAAAFALVLLVNGWSAHGRTILSVNDMAVSYQPVEIESVNRGLYVASSEQGYQITVPLEIDVEEKTHVSVSMGTLQQIVEEEALPVTRLDIYEKTVIYWALDGNTNTSPVCTITAGEKTYQYLIAFNKKTSSYTIQKMK